MWCSQTLTFPTVAGALHPLSPRIRALTRSWCDFSPAFPRLPPDVSVQIAEPFAFTNSFVGTEEYLSPEVCNPSGPRARISYPPQVINATGHSSAVDWWELGIFLYELVYGFTPFRGSHREQTFDNVLHKELIFPPEPPVTPQCQELIRGLLVRDPAKRLGAKSGAEEIKAQDFYASIAFNLIRSTLAPFAGRALAKVDVGSGETLLFDGI